ncbi:MAG: hypothetical protein HY998_04930 [candidate division NC10 bacterium]|nr:hypothetical protein [candidate division NC10 bacterium]
MKELWFRRRNFLVRPSFQIKYAVYIVSFLFIYTFLLGFLIFYPLQQALQGSSSLEERVLISREVLILHKRLWPWFFAVILLVGVHSILTTHRIAGPLFRVETTLRRIIQGDFSQRIKLRRHDEFLEFEELINQLAERLEASTRESQIAQAGIKEEIKEFCALVLKDPLAGQELKSRASILASALNRI